MYNKDTLVGSSSEKTMGDNLVTPQTLKPSQIMERGRGVVRKSFVVSSLYLIFVVSSLYLIPLRKMK